MSTLPRWDVSDVHESLRARSFVLDLERAEADATRLLARFDEHHVGTIASRPATPEDGAATTVLLDAMNDLLDRMRVISGVVQATASTNSYDEEAHGLASRLSVLGARLGPLHARLAAWVAALDADALAEHSPVAAEHIGPLRRMVRRAEHQMPDEHEGLYAELTTTGSGAWARLHADVTSRLSADVVHADGRVERLPMAAVRGLATHPDPAVRRCAYEAEQVAWPEVALVCAAAMNSIKGEAITVNARRSWATPLDASLFANNVSRATFDSMRSAVQTSLPDFRRWLRSKARVHGHSGPLPFFDLFSPSPHTAATVTWEQGLAVVRDAFAHFGGPLGGLVDRAIDERWIDAEPRDGKRGGAFCMPFAGDRSLVFLNWSGSLDSTQTTAHELGHAYHNLQMAGRTPLQRSLPMALAETASIFCETLVVETGLRRATGLDRLALLDVDLVGSTQVVVDIESRILFESEVFARRRTRTLGVSELNEIMLQAQADAYGDGLDQSTAHRYMWAVKPHYYSSHFYNWPYTYGLLFGLGLFAAYERDPERFRAGYDILLSRAGMDTAEELAAAFGLDVTTEEFWTASLDVVRRRIAEYEALAGTLP